MSETEQASDLATSEETGAWPRHPRSLANLRPAWKPGESGNPSGLTKDGKSPKAQALASALQDELMQSGGMSALAKRWVQLAKKGNSTALAAILERLYPVEKEGGEGRQILTGIKLELSEGKTTATLIAALDAQNAVPLLGSSSTQGRIEAECPADSAATTPTGLAPGADQLPAGQDSATAERAATSPTSAPNGPGASSD